MGFLDKAKAAANDLAAQANSALNNSGMGSSGPNPQQLFRDLGMLVYDEHAGRPVAPDVKGRLLAELSTLEQQGRLLPPAPQPGPPPPPGSNAGGAGYAAPPPPPAPGQAAAAPTSEPPAAPSPAPGPQRATPPPPPPPPNWQS